MNELADNAILEKRRYYVKSIIEVIIFLIENEVGFRGNWDEEQHKEEEMKDNE